jgi:hypothetical protein
VKFSKLALAETGRMFALWHAFRRGIVDRKTLVRKSVPIRARIRKYLSLYAHSSDHDVRKSANSLLNHWDGLFTSLDIPVVEPTNNAAERALPPAVQ